MRNPLPAAHPSTFLVKRSAIDSYLGLVDERLPGSYAEDYDWLIRAARERPIVAVRDARTLVQWHKQSYFVDRWEMIDEALAYLVAKTPEFDSDPRGLARILGQRAFAQAASGHRKRALATSREAARLDWRRIRAYAAPVVSGPAPGLWTSDEMAECRRTWLLTAIVPSRALETVMSTRPRTRDIAAVAKGGSLNIAGSAVGGAMSMLLILVVTRGFGAEVAGAFFESIALFTIIVICATLGADTGMVRFTARALALDGRTGLWRLLTVALVPVMGVAVIASIVGMANAAELGSALGGRREVETVTQMVTVLAFFVPIGALNLVVLAATRGYGTMVPTVTAERLVRTGTQLIFGLVCVIISAGTAWLVGGWGAGVALSLVIGVAWLRALWERRDSPVAAQPWIAWGDTIREFWIFSLPRAFASAFRVGVLWLDVVLVGALISPTAAAVYTVATRLLQVGFMRRRGDRAGRRAHLFKAARAGGNGPGSVRVSGLDRMVGRAHVADLPHGLDLRAGAPPHLRQRLRQHDIPSSRSSRALPWSAAGADVDVLLVMSGKTMWSLVNSMVAFFANVALKPLAHPEDRTRRRRHRLGRRPAAREHAPTPRAAFDSRIPPVRSGMEGGRWGVAARVRLRRAARHQGVRQRSTELARLLSRGNCGIRDHRLALADYALDLGELTDLIAGRLRGRRQLGTGSK